MQSPIFYCLRPSLRSRVVRIPIALSSTFRLAVAVTHASIPAAAQPFLAVTSDPSAPRFPVGGAAAPRAAERHADEPRGGARRVLAAVLRVPRGALPAAHVRAARRCDVGGAAPSPPASRCTPTSPRCRSSWWCTTGCSPSTPRASRSPRRRAARRLPRRAVDGERVTWGHRLPAAVEQATALQQLSLQLGNLHPGDQTYQTFVLYNRNPVPVTASVSSARAPQVVVRPVFRALLQNRTSTEAPPTARTSRGGVTPSVLAAAALADAVAVGVRGVPGGGGAAHARRARAPTAYCWSMRTDRTFG